VNTTRSIPSVAMQRLEIGDVRSGDCAAGRRERVPLLEDMQMGCRSALWQATLGLRCVADRGDNPDAELMGFLDAVALPSDGQFSTPATPSAANPEVRTISRAGTVRTSGFKSALA